METVRQDGNVTQTEETESERKKKSKCVYRSDHWLEWSQVYVIDTINKDYLKCGAKNTPSIYDLKSRACIGRPTCDRTDRGFLEPRWKHQTLK